MIDKLVEKIRRTGAPIEVGLDPMLDYVPVHGFRWKHLNVDFLNHPPIKYQPIRLVDVNP